MADMESTFANRAGTLARKDRFTDPGRDQSRTADGHFREAGGLLLSSIGIGTYLGNWDDGKDDDYVEAITKYLEVGGNLIDTAGNYRFQRSEKCIGRALKESGVDRSEVFICTKAGYLPFENEPPTDVGSYFEENFVKHGIAAAADLVGGSHCIAPSYLQSQIDQSLKNLDVAGIDLFYLHNPEAQLAEVDRYTFEARIAKAFELLEENRSGGRINYYGVATWDGFRAKPDAANYHSLERFAGIAKQVAGEDHGFKFIQLPYNLAMPEAYLVPNQAVNGKAMPVLQAADQLGLTVMASASLLQGKLAMNVPLHIRETFGGLTTDAMTSLQFVRSTPGITSALVGMSTADHVVENMMLAQQEPADSDTFGDLFAMPA
jgi:aryl-alcohol dehydrogenase-like predicted oxidoreductase